MIFVIVGLLGFLLVASAAAGAHLVASIVDGSGASGSVVTAAVAEGVRVQWERAVSFGLAHLPVALVAVLAFPASRLSRASALSLLCGVVLFSGVQLARLAFEAVELAARPDTPATAGPLEGISWLVPVGGLALHLGWLLLAAAAIWSRPRTPSA
jgi:uncharacterized membrane protein YgdD (TMEM256/DUF423 family)